MLLLMLQYDVKNVKPSMADKVASCLFTTLNGIQQIISVNNMIINETVAVEILSHPVKNISSEYHNYLEAQKITHDKYLCRYYSCYADMQDIPGTVTPLSGIVVAVVDENDVGLKANYDPENTLEQMTGLGNLKYNVIMLGNKNHVSSEVTVGVTSFILPCSRLEMVREMKHHKDLSNLTEMYKHYTSNPSNPYLANLKNKATLH